MAFVEVRDVVYYYPDAEKPALDEVNLTVPPGQFVLVVGGSGCGKSTLARALAGLVPDFYGGTWRGKVLLDGVEVRKMDRRSLVQQVGIVFQDPESQMVMTGVEQEIAFGLENLGLPGVLMQKRLVEVCSALGLTSLLKKFIPELSGGQKQKVALASVLAMQPGILILDEPTSQLDPATAEEILALVRRLNEENGLTVILVEQRLERCFHFADRVLVMENGRVICDGTPEEVVRWSTENGGPFVPPLPRLFTGGLWPVVPLTVKKGREILAEYGICPGRVGWPVKVREVQEQSAGPACELSALVEVRGLWYIYPDGTEALRGVDLRLYPGTFTALMGENAAGKTTLLKSMVGLLKPTRGRVTVLCHDTRDVEVEELAPQVGYLSQNPNDYLFLPTVRDELAFTLNHLGLNDCGIIDATLKKLGLDDLAAANPRDLSTGERQRVALASILVARPKVLLLDEPTRGLDYHLKAELGMILRQLQAEGAAILLVTHDVEFAAEFADDVILMAWGSIIASGSKYTMLTGSTFYSPQVNKLFNGIVDEVVTLQDARRALVYLMQLERGKETESELPVYNGKLLK